MKIRHDERTSLHVSIVLAMLTFCLISPLFILSDLPFDIELKIYDLMLKTRSRLPEQPTPITLITIKDEDLLSLKRTSLNDADLLGVLQNLLEHTPKAIGIDLYRDIPLPPDTQSLASLLNSHPEIIVAKKFGNSDSGGISAPDYLVNSSQAGCTDFPLDPDGKVRRALILLSADNSDCYSFGYLVAKEYLQSFGILPTSNSDDTEVLKLGESNLPRLQTDKTLFRFLDDGGYQIYLDFRFPPTVFEKFSIHDLIDQRIPAAAIKGKIVLIGSEHEGAKDYLAIPDLKTDFEAQKTPGVIVHALFVEQLIRYAKQKQYPLILLSDGYTLGWAIFCCVTGIWIGFRKYSLALFLILVLLGVALNIGISYAYFLFGFWMPLLPALLSWVTSTVVTTAWLSNQEAKQRKTLMSLFSSHVSPEIAQYIWEHRSNFMLGEAILPQRMVATVFFSDIAGFTAIAESMEPERFTSWLNEYLEAVTTIINAHGGVIVRFIGDAIMAGFGIPVPRDDAELIKADVISGASCALEIQKQLIILNRNWSSRGLPEIQVRIGLNSGSIVAGSLGNNQRLEYTIHGDVVNTAARLESYDKLSIPKDLDKASPCRILISESVYLHLDSRFSCLEVGDVQFAGKKNVVKVFQLMKSV